MDEIAEEFLPNRCKRTESELEVGWTLQSARSDSAWTGFVIADVGGRSRRRTIGSRLVTWNIHHSMLVIYFLLALGVSFLCSLMEASLLSLPRSYAIRLKQDGKSYGTTLEHMKQEINRPLAAILTLNTFANMFGAAGVGAEALVAFGSTWVALVSFILTLCILIFSEIIPKTAGSMYCRQLAPWTAYFVRAMMFITWPVTVLLNMVRRFFPSGEHLHSLTRDDVMVIAELSRTSGALELRELEVIQNFLKLRDWQVKDVMTPRTVLLMLHQDTTVAEAMKQYTQTPFSRFPVYGDSPDDMKGLVLRRSLDECARNDQLDRPVLELVRPIHVVPEGATLDNVLWKFFTTGQHMFHVVDEYGGTAGVITLEDAIETMIGHEIVDETDRVVDMQHLARKQAALRERQRVKGGP